MSEALSAEDHRGASRPSAPAAGAERSAAPARYVLLTGAKLNAGDFLIRRRCEELLSALRPGAELVGHDRWRPLEPSLLDGATALVLGGGPALQPSLYPGIYPLLPALGDVPVPIIALGLGWKGVPGDGWTERTYRFSVRSRSLLERLARDGWPVSCRDPATERVLRARGFERTVMTGDPAWYDLEHVGRPFEPPRRLERCVVSMPAAPRFFPQAIDLVRALRARFGTPRVTASFNHGWTEREHLDPGRAAAYARLRDAVGALGIACFDVAGDVAPLLALGEAGDVHVGYRLHTHLLFLSRRKPSLLIEEDGRGSGAAEGLALPGVRAWKRHRIVANLLPALDRAGSVGAAALGTAQRRMGADADAVRGVLDALDAHEAEAFVSFRSVAHRIDEVYERCMRPFVESLP